MYGGESSFRKAGKNVKVVPMKERLVFRFEIPQKWIQKNMDKKFGGNIGTAKDHMKNKELYDKWKEDGKPDQQYYQLSELG